jgi:hypothetical protein
MTTRLRRTAMILAGTLVAGSLAASGAVADDGASASGGNAEEVHLKLTPSSEELADCMPDAKVRVEVKLTTDQIGFDFFNVEASGLPPDTAFTVFLLEQADSPFGAAEYIGDIFTDEKGRAENTFRLIVAEAFSSTLVDDVRVRADLNQVGMWFADPADDDFCLGPGAGGITPFDGDNEAGVQAFNSANTQPLPAP